MAMRKSTLRRHYPISKLPTTRKVARLLGEISSIERRLKNLLPQIKELEFESQALKESMRGLPANDRREEELFTTS